MLARPTGGRRNCHLAPWRESMGIVLPWPAPPRKDAHSGLLRDGSRHLWAWRAEVGSRHPRLRLLSLGRLLLRLGVVEMRLRQRLPDAEP